MHWLIAVFLVFPFQLFAQSSSICDDNPGYCGMLTDVEPLDFQANVMCSVNPTAPWCVQDPEGWWKFDTQAIQNAQQQFFDNACLITGHHCVDDLPPGSCVLGNSGSICGSSYSYTLTFQETGRDCNPNLAYWKARWAIDDYCDARNGVIIPIHDPLYRLVGAGDGATGSCPADGPGIGRRYWRKLEAQCNAPKPGFEHLYE